MSMQLSTQSHRAFDAVMQRYPGKCARIPMKIAMGITYYYMGITASLHAHYPLLECHCIMAWILQALFCTSNHNIYRVLQSGTLLMAIVL